MPGAVRHQVMNIVLQLIDLLDMPFFTTLMGKGSISETKPSYGGLYAGAMSEAGAKEYVENADCVVKVGNFPVSYDVHLLLLNG